MCFETSRPKNEVPITGEPLARSCTEPVLLSNVPSGSDRAKFGNFISQSACRAQLELDNV